MPTNRIHQLIAAGLVTVALAATPGTASAPASGETSASPPVERVARELRTGAKSVIVFVSAGDTEYVATGGARRPTGDQRFRVGSVTKTFTATIVLKLAEVGALRLDSTLEDHVPGVIPRGDEITIRHLLQHRSGLANVTEYPSWLERALRSPSTRPIDTLRFAGSKPLAFAPGSQGRYSNTNYIALGLVIEKVTGHSYAQELEKRILKPLGLDHTELPQTRHLPDLDDGGHNPSVPWAAGAIVSNAHDLSRFYSALSRAHSVQCHPRDDEEDSRRCGARDFFDRAALRTRLGPRGRHPRLRDARQRERGGRPCRCCLPPRAWKPAGRRESPALRRASACRGLCASDLEDHLQQRPRSALRHERRRERAAVADAERGGTSCLVARRRQDRLRNASSRGVTSVLRQFAVA